MFPHDGSTYETLLATADQGMYRDKAARRGLLTRPRTPSTTAFIATEIFEAASSDRPELPLPQTLA